MNTDPIGGIPVFGEAYRSKPSKSSKYDKLVVGAKLGMCWLNRKLEQVSSLALWLTHESAIFVAGLTLKDKKELPFRDWTVHFDRTEGKKGDFKIITTQPQCFFRGEKMIAFDGNSGYATRISSVLIGQMLQVPAGREGNLTACFGPLVSGNGLKWRTCDPAFSISITIEFLEDSYWEATVLGKAAF